MKQGDQEKNKKDHSLQEQNNNTINPAQSQSIKSRVNEDGGQSNQGFDIEMPRDENVFEENLYDQQEQIIIQPGTHKNVSSRPPPIQTPMRDYNQNSPDQVQANNGQDSQQQEAVPQFSTDPDQDSPSLPPQHSYSHHQQQQHNPLSSAGKQQQSKPLVTQFGRELSGNSDPDLNFKKKSIVPIKTQNATKKKLPPMSQARNSSQGAVNDNESQISPIPIHQNNTPMIPASKKALQLQKNPTMRIQTQSQGTLVMSGLHGAPGSQLTFNGKPGFSQQRTINLNFFDDLQLGIDNNGPGPVNLNYEIASSNKGPEQWFQDANFSAIYKNPKGSELIVDGDYEDEKIYESRELGYTPQILDSVSREDKKYQMPQSHMSNNKSPLLQSAQNSVGLKPENHQVISGQVSDKIDVIMRQDFLHFDIAENSQQNPSQLQIHNNLIHKNQTMKITTDYQSQQSEQDTFLPRLNLMSGQNKHHHLAKEEFVNEANLLKPKDLKQNSKRRLSSLKVQTNQSNKESSMMMPKKLETSVLHVDENEDNSEIVKRFDLDMNLKPQLDDKRARMLIVNQFNALKNNDQAGDTSFFMIIEKDPIENVENISGRCMILRKIVCTFKININSLALSIIKSKIFEGISLIVIMANSVSLAIEDPTSEKQESYQDIMDTLFLVLYSVEMGLKILGLGFLFNKGAYLRDAWNLLDFTIVIAGYLSVIFEGGGVNLSGLRAFRVLRPLKSISSIAGLKTIVSALLASLPLLRDTVIVLLFFFFIFAIAGLQLFAGILKKRCVAIETGVPHYDDDFCGFEDCPPGFFCGKRISNPNYDQTNFDTIFYSLIAIFTSVTLEGWTSIMSGVSKSYTNLAFLFFIPLVFIGAFFLMNLTLAVIKSKFSKEHEKRNEEKKQMIKKQMKAVEENLDFIADLNDEQKDKWKQAEQARRDKVLIKWKMIMLIKTRIRYNIQKFKAKRAQNETKNKLANTVSTNVDGQVNGLGHTIGGNKNAHNVDYGLLFSSIYENRDEIIIDAPDTYSSRLDYETQQSQRQLLSSMKQNSQISLMPLNTQDCSKSLTTKPLNFQNLRQLQQDAIEEEDDEYKTEFSNIIGSNHLHISGQHFQKNLRQGSFGSKSTPKSRENLISRKSSSNLNLHFLNQNPNSGRGRITIQSPDKQMKMIGMEGFQGKGNKKNSGRALSIPSSSPKPEGKNLQIRPSKRQIKIDEQFFADFITKDLDTLEQMFSEQQLEQIVQKFDPFQDTVHNSSSRMLDLLQNDDLMYFNEQLSDMSIGSEEEQNFRQTQDHNRRSLGNGDERTPYTSVTGFYPKRSGNNYYRQRSKNTQHNFLSENLSISDIYETGENDFGQADVPVQNGQDDKIGDSPATYKSLTNDIMLSQSNDFPLNKQLTDLDMKKRDDLLGMEMNQQQEPKSGFILQKQGNLAQKPEALTNHYQNNSSQSNITTANQNGTIHSDANLFHGNGPLIKSKKTPEEFNTFRSKFGSGHNQTKIMPFGAGSYNHIDEDTNRPRHGPNTISNADTIPLEKSVLNVRYLINHEIEKSQKVYLRKDKFDFIKSQEDIFEQRDAIRMMKLQEQKRKEATEYSHCFKVKPYSRKMTLTNKIFKADEEQSEYLQHLGMEPGDLVQLIQQQYNDPYLTNLYVTGTLSIAFHDKKEVKKNKTRRIQNVDLQRNFYDYEDLGQAIQPIQFGSDSFITLGDQIGAKSMVGTVHQYQQSDMSAGAIGHSNTSQFVSSPLKRNKTTAIKATKSMIRIMSPQEQLHHDIRSQIFVSSTVTAKVSKSIKRCITNQSSGFDIKKRIGQKSGLEEGALNSAAKREMLLNKAAAKDPKLQRRLIISGINKDIYRSILFRHMFISRRHRITPEEISRRPTIQGMLEIIKDEEKEEGEDEEDEEEDDEDDDEPIRDEFLDLPFDCKIEVLKAKKKAVNSKRNFIQWSGQDVLLDFDPSLASVATAQISQIRVWPKALWGLWKGFQVRLKEFVKGAFFDNFMTIAVFINTIALGMDRYGIGQEESDNLSTLNTVFTWIFICEMSLKIIGLGPIKYFKDKMNYLDCAVVLLSIVEMSFLSGSNSGLSAFRSIRIFRTFRVLRVARLLRSMQSMQVILSVLVKSMDSFIYLFMLLLLFSFIYALLGMQIFGGNYNFDSNFNDPPGVPRTNFDSFHNAFLTTFQILTIESWHMLFYDALRSDVSKPISALYFISWVFLGNFMLLNLFLAILLDSFTEEAPHKKNDEEEDEKQEQLKHIESLRAKEGEELIEYYQEVKIESGDNNKKKGGIGGAGKKKKKKKKKDENMLDESFEYTEEAMLKKTVIKKKKEDFEGVECDVSFYFLSKKNKLRIWLFRMVTHTGFETVILILIILSSIKLVIDTYIFDFPQDDLIVVSSNQIDYFFTAAFAMESLLKALAFGFIQDNGSYLRETWSQLDFFIVTTSLIDASFEKINLPIIKILRLLRTLRPLRFISHNSGMKTIVIALLGSVAGIVNVLIVVMVVWMMFGILAVNFFGGKMQYCTVDTYIMDTKSQCLKNRGEWKTRDYNFDSVPQSMITLFAIATLENWPDTMYNTINIQGLELGPKRFDSPMNGYFFVVYILIGSFLFLNLFVGVIFKEFEDAQDEERASLMLKDSEIKWVDMMKMIVNSTPDLETTNKPKQKWRSYIHGFMTGFDKPTNYVDMFVMACIILNMLQMAVSFEGSSAEYNAVLDNINYFFTGVFSVECILKLIGFGWSYFKTSWNIFDFCVVLASNFDIVMGQLSSTSLKFLRVGPQLARIMRVLRVSRLFRLVNKYKGLQALIQTITFSLPSLFNVFSLLMLVYFIFAVLGTFLFRGIKRGMVIDEYNNFENFSNSMLILIRMSTGEDWNYIMYDCMRTEVDNCVPNETCGVSYAYVFFIPYMMISTFIMLNLFILVIIQQFNMYYLDDSNVLDQFKTDLELFKKTWTDFTRDHNCLKLKDTKLVAFFAQMEPGLGMKGLQVKDIIKNVVQMDLVSDEEGFVYFNELLFKAMRRAYGETHVKNKILVEHELRTIKKIDVIKQQMKKKSLRAERTQAAQVNPFMLQMYMNISFKAWLKIFKENLEKRDLEKQNIYLDTASNKNEDDSSNIIEEIDMDDWEYKTEEDLECSFDEGSFEDDSGEDNQVDSSRMLRKTIQVDILKTKTQFDSSLIKLHEFHPEFKKKQTIIQHDSLGNNLNKDFEIDIHLPRMNSSSHKGSRRHSKNSGGNSGSNGQGQDHNNSSSQHTQQEGMRQVSPLDLRKVEKAAAGRRRTMSPNEHSGHSHNKASNNPVSITNQNQKPRRIGSGRVSEGDEGPGTDRLNEDDFKQPNSHLKKE